jgi:hypothetical protein
MLPNKRQCKLPADGTTELISFFHQPFRKLLQKSNQIIQKTPYCVNQREMDTLKKEADSRYHAVLTRRDSCIKINETNLFSSLNEKGLI